MVSVFLDAVQGSRGNCCDFWEPELICGSDSGVKNKLDQPVRPEVEEGFGCLFFFWTYGNWIKSNIIFTDRVIINNGKIIAQVRLPLIPR
jgi:hypothetical protein